MLVLWVSTARRRSYLAATRVIETSWRKARGSVLHFLFMAEHLDVFLHKRSIGTAKYIGFHQVLLFHIQKCLCIEVVTTLEKIHIEVIVAKTIINFTSL